MSSTGLNSGLYSQIREYAELLDRVLLDIKSGLPDAHKESRLLLGRLLTDTATSSTADLRVKLFASLLRKPGTNASGRLVEIGSAILENRVTPAVMRDLETLAKTLEQERAGVFAKLRGQ